MKGCKLSNRIRRRMDYISSMNETQPQLLKPNHNVYRIKPKTKSEKKKYFEMITNKLQEEDFQALFQYLKTKLRSKYQKETKDGIDEIINDIIFNTFRYGSEITQWKEFSSAVDLSWLQSSVITPFFSAFSDNQITSKIVFRKIIMLIYTESLKGNITPFHTFRSIIGNCAQWDFDVELELIKEIAIKGNELWAEYLTNPIISNYLVSHFGVKVQKLQEKILKMRVLTLEQCCFHFYRLKV